MKISVDNFSGIAPRYGAKNLPPNSAQAAENVRLESGEIRATTQPAPIVAPVRPLARTIFPAGGPSFTYLSWDVDVDVARSPLADDEGRIYYTGDGVPKKSTLALASSGPGPYPAAGSWLHLGVPKPTATLTAVASGTGGVTETRAYVYTFVTQFGSVLEESAPSAPVSVTLTSNTTATISNIADPTVTANYNYAKKRLYRTVGAGAFTLVAEIPLGTTTFADNLTTILGDNLPSADWAPPPSDLKGLCLLPGGVLCGFRNNEIWFSEPEFPHAFPPKYMQTVNATVVAIRPFGNNLAVATTGYPEVGSGLYPESFTFAVVPMIAPCVAKRSMAGDEAGVLFASSQGLVSIGTEGNGLATQGVLTRYEFDRFNPLTIDGIYFDRKYYGFYTVDDQTRAFVFQRGDNPPLSTLSVAASAAVVEPRTNRLVVLDRNTGDLAYVDPLDTLPMTFLWRSKVFDLPYPMNMAAARVVAPDVTPEQARYVQQVEEFNQSIVAFNSVIFATGKLGSTFNATPVGAVVFCGSLLKTPMLLPSTKFSVYIYADGRLVFTKGVMPQVPFRLPAGFKARAWEIAVAGQAAIQRLEMATSMQELIQ